MLIEFILLSLFKIFSVIATPDGLLQKGAFTVQQQTSRRTSRWSVPSSIYRTYRKHGLEIPPDVKSAMARQSSTTSSSVTAKSVLDDTEYVIKVKVGEQNLTLNLDTGSADLWVFSTLLPKSLTGKRTAAQIYDPKSSGGKIMSGESWDLSYQDGTGAKGQVYQDKVTIGDHLTVPNQAVEAASWVSEGFASSDDADGLIGLAFSDQNGILPNIQKTWFDNVRGSLAHPSFAAAIKRRQPGSYDFGHIDASKFSGSLAWTPVVRSGYWDFDATDFSFGNTPYKNITRVQASIDTGSGLWYLPRPMAETYWKQIKDAKYSPHEAAWTFPCSSSLPDISMKISGKRLVVPGINMNYQQASVGGNTCIGGLQPDTQSSMTSYIFGDVFIKGMYVVFEHPVGGKPRLGFAQQK
ncbi:putative aspartic-type endopeptidase [Microthyrium microscopicum]|uniref:Putative aspartic-type endopeptidase n=1 Tax=Microthyrium microscopicum TaxID=703497 RepID=A0A6A6UCM3_9PEZI|nr:putative aspartic-type endopeptidase [Microthyrium microscopicum]